MPTPDSPPRERLPSALRRLALRRLGRACAAGLLGLLAFAVPRAARADVSSWLYIGGGPGVLDRATKEDKTLLHIDTGLGTNPASSLVFGGLFRGQALFGSGLDLGLVSRLVTGGFVRGGFGGGIDLGVSQRWWGEGSTGLTGNLVLGAPWGLTVYAGGTLGSNDERLIFATIGFDFARLTVHRQTGLDWFANPMSSPRD
jgi:hypothetical protein